jgi:hypothetical protein
MAAKVHAQELEQQLAGADVKALQSELKTLRE